MADAEFDDLLYLSGLTAQGCWDQMDTYDHAAIRRLVQLVAQRCHEIVSEHDSRECAQIAAEIQRRFDLSI